MSAGWSPQARLYTTPAADALRARSGPASASASTLTMTMCLPLAIASTACRMPAAGMPVASTTTSISGHAIKATASAVTCVRLPLHASASEAAEIAGSAQPAVSSCVLARMTSRSATATTCMPRVTRACARNMVPNLPAPITPTVTGLPAASRLSNMAWRFTASSIGDRSAACTHTVLLAWAGLASAISTLSVGSTRGARPQQASLAHRARDEDLSGALGAAGRTAFEQEPSGFALLLGAGIEAFAGLKPLAAAKRHGRRLAVRSAVVRRSARLARIHDSCVRKSDHGGGRILRGFARLAAELIELVLSALHIGLEATRPFFQPVAQRIDKAGLLGRGGW